MRRAALALLVVSPILGAAGSAHAIEYQATVVGSSGYTDNASVTAAGDDASTASMVMSLRPALELVHATPKTVNRLGLSLSGSLFSGDADSSSVAGAATFGNTTALGPRTSLLLDLGTTYTQNNTLGLSAAPASAPITAVSSGTTRFVAVNGGEGFSHELTPLWRAVQGLTVVYNHPLEELAVTGIGDSFQGTFVLGLERQLQHGTFSLGATGGTAWAETRVSGRREQLSTGALARWIHELSARWSSELQGGYELVFLQDGSESDLQPVGRALVTWRDPNDYTASFGYQRGASLNPYIGVSLVTDEISARGEIPLEVDRWMLSGAAGWQYATPILPDPALAMQLTAYTVLSADLGVAFNATPSVAVGLRYQFSHQESEATSTTMLVPDVTRQTVLLTVSARWPTQPQTAQPFLNPLRMQRNPNLDDELPGRNPGARPLGR